MILALVAVIVGVFFMGKGGKLNEKYGNKLMFLRVAFQAVAVVLLYLIFSK